MLSRWQFRPTKKLGFLVFILFVKTLTIHAQTRVEDNEDLVRIHKMLDFVTELETAIDDGKSSKFDGLLNQLDSEHQIIQNGYQTYQKKFSNVLMALSYVISADYYATSLTEEGKLQRFRLLQTAEPFMDLVVTPTYKFPFVFKNKEGTWMEFHEKSILKLANKCYAPMANHIIQTTMDYNLAMQYLNKAKSCCLKTGSSAGAQINRLFVVCKYQLREIDEDFVGYFEAMTKNIQLMDDDDLEKQFIRVDAINIIPIFKELENKIYSIEIRYKLALAMREYIAKVKPFTTPNRYLIYVYNVLVESNETNATLLREIIRFSKETENIAIGNAAVEKLANMTSDKNCTDLRLIGNYYIEIGEEGKGRMYLEQADACDIAAVKERRKQERIRSEEAISISWNIQPSFTKPGKQNFGGYVHYQKNKFVTQLGFLQINGNDDHALDVAYFNRPRRNSDGESNIWDGFRINSAFGSYEGDKKTFMRYSAHVGYSRQNFRPQSIMWTSVADTTEKVSELLSPKVNMFELAFNYYLGKRWGPIGLGAETILGVHYSRFNSTSEKDPKDWEPSKMLLNRKPGHFGFLARMNLYITIFVL